MEPTDNALSPSLIDEQIKRLALTLLDEFGPDLDRTRFNDMACLLFDDVPGFELMTPTTAHGVPPLARREAGFQLDRVQRGLEPFDWRPMSTAGSGTCVRFEFGMNRVRSGCSM